MAGRHLIDAYLETLARQMSWRSDHDDVASEVRDHLYCAAERLEADGLDTQQAQRQVLDEFGEPSVVATAFATTGTRGIALPTAFTVRAGTMARVASAGWLVLAVAWIASQAFDRDGDWGASAQGSFMIGWFGLLVAAILTTIVLAALDTRHGGFGVVGRAGVAVAGLGVLASILGWFIAGWGLLIGMGALLISLAVVKRGLAPRAPAVLLGASWGTAMVLFILLNEVVGLGSPDEWGDYPWARVVAVVVGSTGTAVGLWGIGRWLASERPVQLDPRETSAATA